MSEVIVRMEKVPKNCDDSCWGYLSGECPWSDHVDGYTMNSGRPRNCPIIGVLPETHGRLIDEAVFCENVVKYSHQSTKTIGKALNATPTIIEMTPNDGQEEVNQ